MNATPATKAAAQATVRDKQANEARISGGSFFFRANVVGDDHRHPYQSDFCAKPDRFPKCFPTREIDRRFPDASHPKNLVKKGFSRFLPTFPAPHFREDVGRTSQ
jgi:hypothetical protein